MLHIIKEKQQWDTTAYLLEWAKPKTLPPPNAGEVLEQQELSLLDATWDSQFGTTAGSFLQNKYTPHIWLAIALLGTCPNIGHYIFPITNLHVFCLLKLAGSLGLFIKSRLSPWLWTNNPWGSAPGNHLSGAGVTASGERSGLSYFSQFQDNSCPIGSRHEDWILGQWKWKGKKKVQTFKKLLKALFI